jgi:hypothetical protein
MCSIFDDAIWVAQSATHGNIEDTAVHSVTVLMQAVSAIGQHTKLGLYTFPFLAAGVYCQLLITARECLLYIYIYNVLSHTICSFTTGFPCC